MESISGDFFLPKNSRAMEGVVVVEEANYEWQKWTL